MAEKPRQNDHKEVSLQAPVETADTAPGETNQQDK